MLTDDGFLINIFHSSHWEAKNDKSSDGFGNKTVFDRPKNKHYTGWDRQWKRVEEREGERVGDRHKFTCLTHFIFIIQQFLSFRRFTVEWLKMCKGFCSHKWTFRIFRYGFAHTCIRNRLKWVKCVFVTLICNDQISLKVMFTQHGCNCQVVFDASTGEKTSPRVRGQIWSRPVSPPSPDNYHELNHFSVFAWKTRFNTRERQQENRYFLRANESIKFLNRNGKSIQVIKQKPFHSLIIGMNFCHIVKRPLMNNCYFVNS